MKSLACARHKKFSVTLNATIVTPSEKLCNFRLCEILVQGEQSFGIEISEKVSNVKLSLWDWNWRIYIQFYSGRVSWLYCFIQ